jgi:post-segregation antitoxin (ccd killing protein)
MAAMGVDTATIRVARGTRDRLAQQARQRGISISALLAEMAHERELEAIYESERQAILADAQNPAVIEEMRLWESTLEDGIDFDDGLSVD